MIFATVGTQLPFPRLIASLEEVAKSTGINVFAQTADYHFKPRNIKTQPFLSPIEYSEKMLAATAIVSHAGIGTLLSAIRHQKPLIIMPRLASLGEHRNDHQVATVKHVATRLGIYVAHDMDDLHRILSEGTLTAAKQSVGPELNSLQSFVLNLLQDNGHA